MWKPSKSRSRPQNGADDESARGNSEGGSGEANLDGCGRDHGCQGQNDAALRERLNAHGYRGLWDDRRRWPSPRRVPMEMKKVLSYIETNI